MYLHNDTEVSEMQGQATQETGPNAHEHSH